MSWFIKFLKCILCVEDEETEVSRNWRPYHEYQRLSTGDPYSRTTLTQSPLRSQPSFAKTTTSSKISNKLYENSMNSPSVPNRESIQSNSLASRNLVAKSCNTSLDPCNKVPVVSSQFSLQSSVKPPSAMAKTNLSPISDQSRKVPPKPKSHSSVEPLSATIKTNLSPISEKSGEVPVKTKSYSSVEPPSATTKTNLSLISEKAGNVPLKTKSYSSVEPPSATTKTNLSLISEKSGKVPLKTKSYSSVEPPSAATKKNLSPISEKSGELPVKTKSYSSSSSSADVPRTCNLSSTLPQSPKPPPLSTKPTLSPLLSGSTTQEEKNKYVWLEKSGSTTYVFPEDIKSLIKKDIVPGVLKMPLSPSTYKNYFHALLYAEDCHLEKWEGFEVKNVTLELHDATIYAKKRNSKSYNDAVDKDEKVFVAFDIDKILERQSQFDRKHERRPFLLSRDFVSLKPTGRNIKPFQGVIYRVVKSSLVLAEFGESFHSQHEPECGYDIKFSFNRICLKRAHQAITAAADTLYWKYVFPAFAPKQELPSTDLFVNYRYQKEAFAVWKILRLQSATPYLVEGPLSVVDTNHLSRTAFVIVGAVLQICQKSPSNRVLLCAPLNKTCDELMIALKKEMDECDMFRANATFREIYEVPVDILPSCLYEEESDCFACPSLEELKKYKVISSTFMSSFRLRDKGMVAGHFSHIFLVDASSVTEPEAMVPLANFVNSETIVVVTGAPGNHSGWVRSKIARQNGLMTSYFERLRESELYKNLDPRVITQLEARRQNWNESSKSLSSFLDHISLYF